MFLFKVRGPWRYGRSASGRRSRSFLRPGARPLRPALRPVPCLPLTRPQRPLSDSPSCHLLNPQECQEELAAHPRPFLFCSVPPTQGLLPGGEGSGIRRFSCVVNLCVSFLQSLPVTVRPAFPLACKLQLNAVQRQV